MTENTMSNPKVLIGSPVYNKMEYCIKQFFDSIKNIEYDNYDILLIDNSEGYEFFNKLKQEEKIIVIKDDTKETENIQKVISSRNKILKYAFDNNYDYLLMMDCDVLPPKNILSELIKCNKDIVSGLYFNYFQRDGELMLLPIAWKTLTPEEFEDLKTKVNLPSDIQTNLDVRRHLFEEEVESNELLEVHFPSAGCMLISKKVLENETIKYGLEKISNNRKTSDEIYFINRARELGFKIYCYTKLKCEHLAIQKYEKDNQGNLIHPWL